jgi:hypothetical protein
VPWCQTCDRFLSPPTVRADGTCPSCGRAVDAGAARSSTSTTDEAEELGPLPWHVKLLAVALAVYLGYRAWQGIDWIIGRF